MDILLAQAKPYALPTSRRVGVIVHDGTTDLRLWPGPGPDRDLLEHYGPDLSRVLDAERTRAGGAVPVGTLIRLHPGRLHCDFLLWIATRGPEQKGYQAQAPDREVIAAAIRTAIDFASERNVIRIAVGALGAGPSAVDDTERLAIVARTIAVHSEDRSTRGLPSQIEEAIVCDERLSVVTAARRMVGSLAKAPPPEKPLPGAAPAKAPKMAKTPREVADAKKRVGTTRGKPRLDEMAVARARASAKPWDRSVRYGLGSWFVHVKFGAGRVEELTADGFIVCLFEDGEIRKLIHNRPA